MSARHRNDWRRRGWVRESTHSHESYHLPGDDLRMVTTAHPGWYAAAGRHQRVRLFRKLRHAMDYVENASRRGGEVSPFCAHCNAPTMRCEEDALYKDDDGPLCDDCWMNERPEDT